jgi:hypothetical protein
MQCLNQQWGEGEVNANIENITNWDSKRYVQNRIAVVRSKPETVNHPTLSWWDDAVLLQTIDN